MRYLFFILFFIIICLGILIYLIFDKDILNLFKKSSPELLMTEKILIGKKIAMVIAFKDFRDEELFIPRSIFLDKGAEVKLISEKKGEALGMFGGVTKVDFLFEELEISDFEAIIFVGGSGAADYINNERVHQIARLTIEKDKILGAICIAPAILARSGVLKNKKATVWSGPLDKSAVKILKEEGVNYEEKPVVIDGKIVTANGPQVARQFAEKIIELLKTESK